MKHVLSFWTKDTENLRGRGRGPDCPMKFMRHIENPHIVVSNSHWFSLSFFLLCVFLYFFGKTKQTMQYNILRRVCHAGTRQYRTWSPLSSRVSDVIIPNDMPTVVPAAAGISVQAASDSDAVPRRAPRQKKVAAALASMRLARSARQIGLFLPDITANQALQFDHMSCISASRSLSSNSSWLLSSPIPPSTTSRQFHTSMLRRSAAAADGNGQQPFRANRPIQLKRHAAESPQRRALKYILIFLGLCGGASAALYAALSSKSTQESVAGFMDPNSFMPLTSRLAALRVMVENHPRNVAPMIAGNAKFMDELFGLMMGVDPEQEDDKLHAAQIVKFLIEQGPSNELIKAYPRLLVALKHCMHDKREAIAVAAVEGVFLITMEMDTHETLHKANVLGSLLRLAASDTTPKLPPFHGQEDFKVWQAPESIRMTYQAIASFLMDHDVSELAKTAPKESTDVMFEALLQIAELLETRGLNAAAIRALQKAQVFDPSNANVSQSLLWVAFKLKRPDLILDEFHKSVRQLKKSAQIGGFMREDKTLDPNVPRDTDVNEEALITLILKLVSETVPLFKEEADIRSMLQFLDDFVPGATSPLAFPTSYGAMALAKARLHSKLEEYNEAVESYETLSNAERVSTALFGYTLYVGAGRPDDALQLLEHAGSLQHSVPSQYYLTVSEAQEACGDMTAAEEAADLAVRHAYARHSKSLKNLDARSDSKREVARADAYVYYRACMTQGRLLASRNDVDGAIVAYKRAVNAEPESSQPLFEIASLEEKLGNASDAVAYYVRVVKNWRKKLAQLEVDAKEYFSVDEHVKAREALQVITSKLDSLSGDEAQELDDELWQLRHFDPADPRPRVRPRFDVPSVISTSGLTSFPPVGLPTSGASAMASLPMGSMPPGMPASFGSVPGLPSIVPMSDSEIVAASSSASTDND
jgi:tetratricopeptide (TPR) repeat protein